LAPSLVAGAQSRALAGNLTGGLNISTGSTLDILATDGLNVSGDVILDGTLNATDTSAGIWLGSLDINSGGVYNATSGTTTITSESGTGYAINNDGAFTSNSGIVAITTATAAEVDLTGTSGSLNDLRISSGSSITFEGAASIGDELNITTGSFYQSSPANALTISKSLPETLLTT